MCESRFFICNKCGNTVGLIHGAGVPLMCCGEQMEHLEPQLTDDVKHTPVVDVSDGTVCVHVGKEKHPMLPEHGVRWIYMQTDRGGQRKCLENGEEPAARFMLCDEKPTAVYAYCDKHGLWKTAL